MKQTWTWAVLACVWLSGCRGATGNVTAEDPMERGLSYIAAAIVTHAVLGILFKYGHSK